MNIDQSLSAIQKGTAPNANNAKLPELWDHVRPFVVMAGTIFGKKVKPYINAFVAALDALVAKEDAE